MGRGKETQDAQAGIKAMRKAIQTYRRGGSISHTEAAWLTVSLRDLWVRDDACARMDPTCRSAYLRLCVDCLTRLARPGYVSAPATLLAHVTWQAGNGTLANMALDRVVTVDRTIGWPPSCDASSTTTCGRCRGRSRRPRKSPSSTRWPLAQIQAVIVSRDVTGRVLDWVRQSIKR